MYFLLSGTLPFYEENEAKFIEKISKAQYDVTSKFWKTISKEAKDLLSCLLKPNPQLRLSAEQALKHPWFEKYLKKDNSIDLNSYQHIKSISSSFTQKLNPIITEILSYISTQMLTNQEESSLCSLFKALDADGNGKLSKEELSEASSKFGILNREEIDVIFDTCDVDKSGFIDYSEFLTVSMTWNKVLKKEKIQMVFNFFDESRDGNLTISELKTFFPKISEKDWKEFISEIDQNGDGDISLEEFRDYLAKFIQE